MPKTTAIGTVTSDKAAKTRRVEIARLVRHKKYGKILRRKTVCHVHDETEEAHLGDTVEIRESRPRSKNKRWELVRVVTKSQLVDIAAMKAALRDEQGLIEVGRKQAAEVESSETSSPAPDTRPPTGDS